MSNWFERFIGRDAASKEADRSLLPGGINGPEDAYRHLLISAELTRRFGQTAARIATEVHELEPKLIGPTANPKAVIERFMDNPFETDRSASVLDSALKRVFVDDLASQMDRHNNEVGIGIGLQAKTWEEVVEAARAAITAAANGTSSGANLPIWLPESEWDGVNLVVVETPDGHIVKVPAKPNWPPDWQNGTDPRPISYEYSGEAYRNGFWAPDDIRRQMSRSNEGFDDRADWHTVRPVVARLYEQGVAELQMRFGPSTRATRTTNGEVIFVRAHKRSGGRVDVDSHTRRRPAGTATE